MDTPQQSHAQQLADLVRAHLDEPCKRTEALSKAIASIESQELPPKVMKPLLSALEAEKVPLRAERLMELLREFTAILKSDFGVSAEFKVLKRRKRRSRKAKTKQPDTAEPSTPSAADGPAVSNPPETSGMFGGRSA